MTETKMIRMMGLDFGSKTVGVAISDALGLMAHPRETIVRKEANKLRRTLARIEELVQENQIETIVLGLPLHMSGEEGERALLTYEFRDKLIQRIGVPVVMWDERLTTVEAMERLDEQQVRRSEQKLYVDQIAAAFILQGYMDHIKAKANSQGSSTG